ncbi:hypothetical protein [Anatilimnocola floriformis]|uniref:hypothetical protein n=1 Tax=Anatilimnocola floriformis TaxID=2948575 RepID=UPI0020C55C39|nr:hypothetical protein [Anatilimnocola floriformis]
MSTLLLIWQRRRRAQPDGATEKEFPRADCKYCGKTLLFRSPGHGNQIEYLDQDGYCYLWYPGNTVILTGKWRIDETSIYFQYGTDTYNPVTNVHGGGWEEQSFDEWSNDIVDQETGDLFGIKRGLPFVLAADPPLNSLRELLSAK